jgi:hypothetical protein
MSDLTPDNELIEDEETGTYLSLAGLDGEGTEE